MSHEYNALNYLENQYESTYDLPRVVLLNIVLVDLYPGLVIPAIVGKKLSLNDSGKQYEGERDVKHIITKTEA